MAFKNSLSIKRYPVSFRMIAFVLFFSASITANAGVPDVAGMLMNVTGALPDFMRLVTASAYVFGMWIVVQGIMELKQYGEQRTQYSSHASLKGPLIQFTVGTSLLYLPSTIAVGLNTFWNDPAPYAYLNESTEQWNLIMQGGFMVMQLIGAISFIKGLLVMSKLGGSGSQQDAFARGLTHMIAGALCINLYDFLSAVNGTLVIWA
jgi:intracellular multiplication protein IcmC